MHTRLHDEEEIGQELTRLGPSNSEGHMEQVALSAGGEASPGIDPDFDPVLGVQSDSLRSSLAHSHNRPAESWRERCRDWCTDRKNAPTIRIMQLIAGGFAVLMLILLIAAYAHTADDTPAPVYNVRLPQTVFPSLYTMVLNASLASESFSGTMGIDVLFASTTDQILFHAVDLDLSGFTLVTSTGVGIGVASAGPTGQHDLFLVSLSHVVSAGTSAHLSMKFAGALLRTLAGFYLSDYVTASGENRTIASTQFESTDARRAFPCFDEPAFKANFSVSLIAPTGYVLLGNMPALSETVVAPGWQRVDFQTTVRMSTYLVAYVVCDFTSVEAFTKRGVPVRVWAPVDKIAQAAIALNASVASVDAYETFFQVLYPLPKLDNIAIPNFAVGAMENWGLVTYRETALLVNPLGIEAMTEQNVVTTVAHELAHQWFGDIVTMSWWNDLWLNEGFASFVEWIGMNAYDNSWDPSGQIIATTQTTAMALDSSQYSHPIVQSVGDPAEIDSLFDMISYDKGCSILLMLSSVMGYLDGQPNFQQGLRAYLESHAYGNAASDDLWNALQNTAPSGLAVTIPQMMHPFTQQVGYPLVTLEWDPTNPAILLATQQRYIELPPSDQDPALRDTQTQRWNVLLKYKTGPVPKASAWLLADSPMPVALNLGSNGSPWMYVNLDRAGYYRVNYPDAIWTNLAAELRGEFASNAEVCGIVDDVWSLALSGHTSYSNAFAVTEFFKDAYSAYTPWNVLFKSLGRVSNMISPDAALTAQFNQWVVSKLINSNAIASPPWDAPVSNADHLRSLLQQLFVGSLVAYNDTASRALANDMFTNLMNHGVEVPVDLRDAVYRVGIEEGGPQCWAFLYARYRSTQDGAEARRILRSLARSRDPAQLQTLLDMTIDPAQSGIKTQDQSRVIIYVSLNPMGKGVAWPWIKAHYDLLFARFGAASFTLSELITLVVGRFHTIDEMNDAKTFFADKPLGTASRALLQAYESVQTTIYWNRDRVTEFAAALQAQFV